MLAGAVRVRHNNNLPDVFIVVIEATIPILAAAVFFRFFKYCRLI